MRAVRSTDPLPRGSRVRGPRSSVVCRGKGHRGAPGLLWLRIAVLAAFAAFAAFVAARGVPQPVRVAPFLVLVGLATVAMLVVTLH